jgi:protein-S-isoprenylcysteine O-methyltransferase Ste14
MSPANHTIASSSAVPARGAASLATRLGVLAYGIVAYALGVAALVAWILIMLGVVPFTGGPLGTLTTGRALVVDLALLAAFGLQHSAMARPAWKARWLRVVGPALERPTYMLATGLVLPFVLWLWQPMATVVWSLEQTFWIRAAYALAVSAWAYLFVATFAIDHFELFGLRQVWSFFVGRPMAPVQFTERWMYRFDRHPIMTGALLGMWVTPTMTLGHLVFATGFSLYVVVGVFFEERTLVAQWGDRYDDYRDRVGAIVPRLPRGEARARHGEGHPAV